MMLDLSLLLVRLLSLWEEAAPFVWICRYACARGHLPRPRQRVRHDPGGADQGEIKGVLAPVHTAGAIGQDHRPVHQQGEGRVHGGQQNRGEAGLHGRQDRNARRDVANPGRMTPKSIGAVSWDWSQAAGCSPMQRRRQSMLNMHQSLSAVLFPGYRRRVLGMLLLHPEESLHGREIARRTGLAAGTLTRELKRLADVGLLNRQRRGNQLVYSANRDAPIFEELAGILRKTSGLADVVAEALEPVTDRVDVAFIFGSVARGAETQGSDVDVLIIGSIDFGTVVDALHTAQQRLARDINPKLFSAREWKVKLREKNPFVLDVLSRKKIFLVGDENGLAELGRHQS
jgi:predicted nucleotidyltransferase